MPVQHLKCFQTDFISKIIKIKDNYSEKVDLWGCGIVLYFIVMGILPFYNEK